MRSTKKIARALAVCLSAAATIPACTREPATAPTSALALRATATAPLPGPVEGPEPWREAFEQAADGLVYSSEADYPFEYFRLPAPGGLPLSPAAFLALLGEPPTTPIRELTYDEFFSRHTTRVDPRDAVSLALIPRYEWLEFTIGEALDFRTVFCVGSVFLRCYVTGLEIGGQVVGMAAWVLET